MSCALTRAVPVFSDKSPPIHLDLSLCERKLERVHVPWSGTVNKVFSYIARGTTY